MCSFCTLSLRLKLINWGLGSCQLLAYGGKASGIGFLLVDPDFSLSGWHQLLKNRFQTQSLLPGDT